MLELELEKFHARGIRDVELAPKVRVGDPETPKPHTPRGSPETITMAGI